METWNLLGERPGPVGYLKVTTRSYAMPSGAEADWDILAGDRSVAVVAITTGDEVVLAQQFRPGPGKVMLELPGGIVEEGEDVVDAAARELREETGYVADQLTMVGQTWLASYATSLRHAVLATGCTAVTDQDLDEDEFCEVVTMPLTHFVDHIRGGELTDADVAWMCLDRLRPWTPPSRVQP